VFGHLLAVGIEGIVPALLAITSYRELEESMGSKRLIIRIVLLLVVVVAGGFLSSMKPLSWFVMTWIYMAFIASACFSLILSTK
jgi:hypothetical protein